MDQLLRRTGVLHARGLGHDRFFYDTKIFQELKLEPPKTEEALFELLETVQKSGKYLPLAFGTKDAWQAAQVLLSGIGPNHWGGEKGRLDLLTGRAKFSDKPYVDAWRSLAKMGEYLPSNHADVGEDEARDLFLSASQGVLSWLATPGFSKALANNLPGFFPLSTHSVEITNHLAKEMAS